MILQILQMDDGEASEEGLVAVVMDVLTHQRAEREAQQVHTNREELAEQMARELA